MTFGIQALAIDTEREGITLQVQATEAHIAKGDRHDCRRCPIALAIRDALAAIGITLDSQDDVKVYASHVELWHHERGVYVGDMLEAPSQFVRAFDNCDFQTAQPFTFQLTLAPILHQLADGVWGPEDD